MLLLMYCTVLVIYVFHIHRASSFETKADNMFVFNHMQIVRTLAPMCLAVNLVCLAVKTF